MDDGRLALEMTSGGYSYTNDVEETSIGSGPARRRGSTSPFIPAQDTEGLQYDYLDAPLENSLDDAPAALTLGDFAGTAVSDLESMVDDTNSIFHYASDDDTLSPSYGSQSVSRGDYDTLPIAPMAKKPIEAPQAASTTGGTNRRHSGVTNDTRPPATPYKYGDLFSAFWPTPTAAAAAANSNSSAAAASANPKGKSTSPQPTSAAARQHRAASATPTVPVTGPGGGPVPEMDRFIYGFDAFLHGNELGFGRQPSFKRLAPGSLGNSKSKGGKAGAAAAAAATNDDAFYYGEFFNRQTGTSNQRSNNNSRCAASPPPKPSKSVSPAPQHGADANADAFSNWLESLEPKKATPTASAASKRAAGAAPISSSTSPAPPTPAIGEDFKKEVDDLMKHLLRDFDMSTPTPGAASSVSNVGASATRRGHSGGADGIDLEAYLSGGYTALPAAQSPAVTSALQKLQRGGASNGATISIEHSQGQSGPRIAITPGASTATVSSVLPPISSPAVDSTNRRRPKWNSYAATYDKDALSTTPSEVSKAELNPQAKSPSSKTALSKQCSSGTVEAAYPYLEDTWLQEIPESQSRSPSKVASSKSEAVSSAVQRQKVTSSPSKVITKTPRASPMASDNSQGNKSSSRRSQNNSQTTSTGTKAGSKIPPSPPKRQGQMVGMPKSSTATEGVKLPDLTSPPNDKKFISVTGKDARLPKSASEPTKQTTLRNSAVHDPTMLSMEYPSAEGLLNSGINVDSFPLPMFPSSVPLPTEGSAAPSPAKRSSTAAPPEEAVPRKGAGASRNAATTTVTGILRSSGNLKPAPRGDTDRPANNTPSHPRRRLNEFRNDGYMLPASFSKSRASVQDDDTRPASTTNRERDREQEVQRTNEERRERIYAFMAKRKAEKRQQEAQRAVELERERQMELLRAEKEQQRVKEAALVSSSPNGQSMKIAKASRRSLKLQSSRDRPPRQTVAAAPYIQEETTILRSQRASSNLSQTMHATRSKKDNHVRAVVVYMADAVESPEHQNNERFIGMNFNAENLNVEVNQPQERARFYHTDEFLKFAEDTKPTRSIEGGMTRRRLSSLTLTEMNRKFLAGLNVALLLAGTPNARLACFAAIREVMEGVLLHLPPRAELFVSIALVRGGLTEDLLGNSGRLDRSTFSVSPVFGPTLDNVGYVRVNGIGQLSKIIADGYKKAKISDWSRPGLIAISMLLKQRRESDVILSSYLITDTVSDASCYTAVLRKSQHSPFALFHAALGGPTLTAALIAVGSTDAETAIPLLSAQHRLSGVINKHGYVGSVQRFIELAQRELNHLVAGSKYLHSNGESASSRTPMRKRLAEQVALAEAILQDPEGYKPKESPEELHQRRNNATPSTATSSPSHAATTPMMPSRPNLVPPTQAILHSQPKSHSTHHSKESSNNSKNLTPASHEARAGVGGSAKEGSEKTSPDSAVHKANGSSNSASVAPDGPVVELPVKGKKPASQPSNESLSAAAHLKHVPAVSVTHAAEIPKAVPNPQPPKWDLTKDSASPLTADNSEPPNVRSTQQLASAKSCTSVSTEYVRRGQLDRNGGGERPLGFMNLDMSGITPSGSKAVVTPFTPNPPKLPVSSDLPARPATHSSNRASQTEVGSGRRTSSQSEAQNPPIGPGPSSGAKLLPGSVAIGANGPQWPSIPRIEPAEIITVTSVESTNSSFTNEATSSGQQYASPYEGDKAPIPTSTKVRTLVIVDPRCRETSNVTYDNTMVIATTEDDFEEYDVDEVREVSSTQREPIQSDVLKELCDTILLGCNAAILGADSRSSAVSAQVLKSVVHTIFAEFNREGGYRSGHLTASVVKLKGESVIDLLQESTEPQKLVIAISPIFGSCVHGVTYKSITSSEMFDATVDEALNRASYDANGRDYGFIFCSLIFKLQVEEESDVLVSSLVVSFAGENVGLYTSVLDRSPLVPRALFHYALGGPSYTVALLGIGSEEARANQMLQVQKRLGEMSNRPTHPGSIVKFIHGIRNDLAPSLMAKYENTTDSGERTATKEILERLVEMVKDAEALLQDFDHHQPKAYLHGEQERAKGSPAAPTRVAGVASPVQPSQRPPGEPTTAASADAEVRKQKQVQPRLPAARRSLPNITAVNPEAEGDRVKALVCYEQRLMGGGTVAVQGNVVLCTSQGGTRFDSDEVIIRDAGHNSLDSKLVDELVSKFLTGHHTGLLAADSTSSAFTPLMLRRIANNVLDALLPCPAGPPVPNGGGGSSGTSTSFKLPSVVGELQVSMALIKDDITADLLPVNVDATYHRFEMEHSPMYGPRIAGVTSHLVPEPEDFDRLLAVAIDNADPALQTADPGIMVVLLTLTQRVSHPKEDVLVSSLLCTAVFDAVHHYQGVLQGSSSEPLDLFKTIIRGPCFTVAMLGVSDEDEDPTSLLRVLNDLSQVRNRRPQPNNMSQYIRELQLGIVKLKEHMTTSSNPEEKEYILNRVAVAEQLLREAEALQRHPISQAQIPARAFVPLGAPPM